MWNRLVHVYSYLSSRLQRYTRSNVTTRTSASHAQVGPGADRSRVLTQDAAAQTSRPAPLDDHARHAAFLALARQCKLWPDADLTALDRCIESSAGVLSDLDRAFSHAIYDTTVRRWTSLEFLVQRSLSQPIGQIEPRLRAVLLGGAAQVVFMDKVPAHAALNHAVEWAKVVIRPGAGKMTNAVLRRVAALLPEQRDAAVRERWTDRSDEFPLESGGSVALAHALLPDDPIERLSLAAACPKSLLTHWLRTRPLVEVKRLALHALVRPPVILNTSHAVAPLVPELVPHQRPGHHVWNGSIVALGALLSQRADIWVQDSSSSPAVDSVRDLRPSLVVDLCAGQGTKTRQLAAIFPSARIIATDADESRVERLSQRFAGSPQVRVLSMKAARAEAASKADLVLLDVPCSNTGVLARRPEAKHRFDAPHLASLLSVQKQIIADTILLLSEAPRGKILYSTCSLEDDENRQQGIWADRWHKLGLSRERFDTPSGEPGGDPGAYSDGSYSVLLG